MKLDVRLFVDDIMQLRPETPESRLHPSQVRPPHLRLDETPDPTASSHPGAGGEVEPDSAAGKTREFAWSELDEGWWRGPTWGMELKAWPVGVPLGVGLYCFLDPMFNTGERGSLHFRAANFVHPS